MERPVFSRSSERECLRCSHAFSHDDEDGLCHGSNDCCCDEERRYIADLELYADWLEMRAGL